MIKTIIVDDDIEMLDWLEQVVPWEENGFKITGRAKNGAEACELCSKNMPDLVITDITMPVLDGLEFVYKIKEIKPDVRCIMLTCHEDFKFAQEALKIDVDDYILKYSLTSESMVEVLKKIKTKIEEDKSKKESERLLKSELLKNRIVLLEKFITDIMEGTLNKNDDILKSAETLNVDLPLSPFRVVCSFIDNYNKTIERSSLSGNLLKFSIMNVAEEVMNEKGIIVCLPYMMDRIVMIVSHNYISLVQHKLKEFHRFIKKYLDVDISSCISSEYKDYSKIKVGLREAEELRDSYFYYGSGAVVTNKETDFYNVEERMTELIKKFQLSIDVNESTDSEKILQQILSQAETLKFNPKKIRQIFMRIAFELQLKANFGDDLIYSMSQNMDTFVSLKNNLLKAFQLYVQNLNKMRITTSRKEINTVLEYIDKHLDENITCESMANMVNMNCSYFSRLFKKEVGLSFTDYMIQQRINKATDFLTKTDMPIEEITKYVGLQQPSYFYKIYKKVTGKTPGEVRNNSEFLNRPVISRPSSKNLFHDSFS